MFKPTANVLSRFSLFLAILFLAACSSSSDGGRDLETDGGSDSETDDVSDPVSDSATLATAVEPGIFDSIVSSRPGRTLVSSSGNYAVYTGDQAGTFGTLTFRGEDTFSGDGTKVYFDETWQSVDGSLEGDAKANSSEEFTAIFTPDTAAPSVGWDIIGRRDPVSDDPRVTMQELSGIYSLLNGSMEVTIIADQPDGLDGTVTGSTAGGCAINGAINIPDPTYNIFEGTLKFDRCPSVDAATSDQREGDYQIIGYLELSSEGAKRLEFAGTNGQVMSLFSGKN